MTPRSENLIMSRGEKKKVDLFSEGNVFAIVLSDGSVGYCHLMRPPIYRFLRQNTRQPVNLDDISVNDVLFVAMVDDSSPKKEWQYIGNREHPIVTGARYEFCSINLITNKPQIHILDKEIFGGEEIKSCNFERCEGLEYAGVWSPDQIADRLLKEFNGQVSEVVSQFKKKIEEARAALQLKKMH